MQATGRRAGLLCAGLIISVFVAGCGGGGKKGSPTEATGNAPLVSNFQIRALTPERAFREVRYLITATVMDLDNDLIGGRVEVRDAATGQVVGIDIDADVLRGSTVTVVLLTNPVPPGRYESVFSVIDAAGHRSNEVPFSVTIVALRQEGSEAPGGTGAGFLDRLMPGR